MAALMAAGSYFECGTPRVAYTKNETRFNWHNREWRISPEGNILLARAELSADGKHHGRREKVDGWIISRQNANIKNDYWFTGTVLRAVPPISPARRCFRHGGGHWWQSALPAAGPSAPPCFQRMCLELPESIIPRTSVAASSASQSAANQSSNDAKQEAGQR